MPPVAVILFFFFDVDLCRRCPPHEIPTRGDPNIVNIMSPCSRLPGFHDGAGMVESTMSTWWNPPPQSSHALAHSVVPCSRECTPPLETKPLPAILSPARADASYLRRWKMPSNHQLRGTVRSENSWTSIPV